MKYNYVQCNINVLLLLSTLDSSRSGISQAFNQVNWTSEQIKRLEEFSRGYQYAFCDGSVSISLCTIGSLLVFIFDIELQTFYDWTCAIY